MKKILFLFSFALLSASSIYSQEVYSKFSFSGYRVVIIPSEAFSIDVKNPDLAKSKVLDNGVLEYIVVDQRGRVPKDTVTIYTNHLRSIKLHNSQLVMDTPLTVDSIRLAAGSSYGTLNVDANFVSIGLAAGSRFSSMGTTNDLTCSVGAGSHLDAAKLLTEDANVHVKGHSSAVINAKNIGREEKENGSVKNVYKADK